LGDPTKYSIFEISVVVPSAVLTAQNGIGVGVGELL
jgi:hypothetical protein